MSDHVVEPGDLVRVEYWLGPSLQFLVYGLVVSSLAEDADGEPSIAVQALYFAETPVAFDTIVIPADQIGPNADPIVIDHELTRLEQGEPFDLEAILTIEVAS